AGIEHVQTHLTGLALEKADQLDDLHSFQTTLEQLIHRELPTPVVHRHDDLVDFLFPADTQEIGGRHDLLVLRHAARLVTLGRNIADDDEAATIRTSAQARDARGSPTCSVHQDAALEDVFVDELVEHRAHD